MSDIASCPSCSRRLRIPESLLGREVKCPGCGATFAAKPDEPAPAPAPAEVLEEADTRHAPKPVKRFRRERDDDEDDDEERRPRRSRRRDDDDDDEDDRRPRRRSRRDEDDFDFEDDDRPRRRRLQPHRGELILTLGILSIFFAHIILGPLAWSMGAEDLRKMSQGLMDPAGRGSTTTGKTIGMVMTILCIVGLVGMCLFLGFFFMMAAATAGSVR